MDKRLGRARAEPVERLEPTPKPADVATGVERRGSEERRGPEERRSQEERRGPEKSRGPEERRGPTGCRKGIVGGKSAGATGRAGGPTWDDGLGSFMIGGKLPRGRGAFNPCVVISGLAEALACECAAQRAP